MNAHFKNTLGNIGPIYVINVLDPSAGKHRKATETTQQLSFTCLLYTSNPDMDAVERRLRGLEEQPKPAPQRRARTKRSSSSAFDDW